MKNIAANPVSELLIRNRQRVRPLNLPLLRRIVRVLLHEDLRQDGYELGIQLVGAARMTRLNEEFLRHSGSTDVITFAYPAADREPGAGSAEHPFGSDQPTAKPTRRAGTRRSNCPVHGEIFICLDDAVVQAKQFGTTWQAELVRYVIHGILHLRGYDDLSPADRRVMKRQENRLLRQVAGRFALAQLGRAKVRK